MLQADLRGRARRLLCSQDGEEPVRRFRLRPNCERSLQKAELALGVKEGYDSIRKQLDNVGKTIDGWAVGAAFGDREFYHGDFLLRAAAALGGIYGNDAVEAMYPMAKTDSTGAPLDGSKHNYSLTFGAGQFPPVNAFWSVTMYGVHAITGRNGQFKRSNRADELAVRRRLGRDGRWRSEKQNQREMGTASHQLTGVALL